MLNRKTLILAVLCFSCLIASAKKKKVILPTDVLQAHTVWVIVEPQTGVDVQDPNANRIALADVENALSKWGRFQLVAEPLDADLIITVRKGHSRLADTTIGGTPINTPPPVIMQPSDSGISAAGRAGQPASPSSSPYPQQQRPYPQMEVGATEDVFTVYRGDPNHTNPDRNPLDTPPVWRYMAKNALESPGVPAVDAFRKLLAEAEKQQNTP
jgi:hypothetical protein